MKSTQFYHKARTMDDSRMGSLLREATAMYNSQELEKLVEEAWGCFDKAKEYRVPQSIPILFFGDLEAYRESELRLLTVGLNPSDKEFPGDEQRFPKVAKNQSDLYIKGLSSYFESNPYEWFERNFEDLLNGAEASYWKCGASTALHTDICSPVATKPTWTGLGQSACDFLKKDGMPLWCKLVRSLKPHAVIFSVGKKHLKGMDETLGNFGIKSRDSACTLPHAVKSRWYEGGDMRSLFVFGPAGRMPLPISAERKNELGQAVEQLVTSSKNL